MRNTLIRKPAIDDIVYIRWPDVQGQEWIEARVSGVHRNLFYAVPTGEPVVGWLGKNIVMNGYKNQVGARGYDTWDYQIPITYRGARPANPTGPVSLCISIPTDSRRTDIENLSGAHWVSKIQITAHANGDQPPTVAHLEYYNTKGILLRGGGMLPIETMDALARAWLAARGLL